MAIGLYREIDAWGNQDSARVRFPDGSELDVSRDEYEAGDHEPPFDELPSKSEYEAHHA